MALFATHVYWSSSTSCTCAMVRVPSGRTWKRLPNTETSKFPLSQKMSGFGLPVAIQGRAILLPTTASEKKHGVLFSAGGENYKELK